MRYLFALVVLIILAGVSLGTTIWAVVDLHERTLRLEQRDCRLEQAERLLDRQIAAAAHVHVTIPPFTQGLCD